MSAKFLQSKRQVQGNVDVLWYAKLGNKKGEQAKPHIDLVSTVVSGFFPPFCVH